MLGCVGENTSGAPAKSATGDVPAESASAGDSAEGDWSGGEQMTPTEMHHGVESCDMFVSGSSGIMLLQVRIDEQGKPLAAKVTKQGGNVPKAFNECAEKEFMKSTFEPRGKVTVVSTKLQI